MTSCDKTRTRLSTTLISLLSLSALVLVATGVSSEQDGPSASVQDLAAAWQRFKSKHQKAYKNSSEENMRYGIWLKNMQLINSHDRAQQSKVKGSPGYTLGVNHLMDLTEEEYAKLRGYKSSLRGKKGSFPLIPPDIGTLPQSPFYTNTVPLSQLPATVNWTAEGFVNPVLDQGSCGDCWAFSAAGSMEGQYYNATRTSALVSEQNLLDCSSTPTYGNQGCNGGSMIAAFEYVIDNKGINAFVTYQYTAQEGPCRYAATESLGYITGYKVVEPYSEAALQQAVALIGPVSVGINANSNSFQLYSGGVYQPSSCPSAANYLDHAVLAVGYGTTSDGQEYWLLKNSWGTDWGIQGYMMLARNANNLCGVATDASFPTIFVPSGIDVANQGSTGGAEGTHGSPSMLAGPCLTVITIIYLLLASYL